jgi:hypothetical protein
MNVLFSDQDCCDAVAAATIDFICPQGIRHVIAPPSAVWRHQQISRRKTKGLQADDGGTAGGDVASPYVKNVCIRQCFLFLGHA